MRRFTGTILTITAAVMMSACSLMPGADGEELPEDFLNRGIQWVDTPEGEEDSGTEPAGESTAEPKPTPDPGQAQQAGIRYLLEAERAAGEDQHGLAAELYRETIREMQAYHGLGLGEHPVPEQMAQTGLARSLKALGRLQEAVTHLEKSLEADPSPVTRAEIAMTLAELADCDEASRHARMVLGENPIFERSALIDTHATAHHALAVCAQLSGDNRQALEHIDQAMEITRDFGNTEDLDRLRDSIRADIKRDGWKAGLNPEARNAHRRAETHRDLEELTPALEAYLEAIRVQDTPLPELERDTARAHLALGDGAAALEHLNHALDIRQSSALRLERGLLHQAESQCSPAMEDARAALGMTSRNQQRNTHTDANLLLANCHHLTGSLDIAREYADQAEQSARDAGYTDEELEPIREILDWINQAILEERQRLEPTPEPTPAPRPTLRIFKETEFALEYNLMLEAYGRQEYQETLDAALRAREGILRDPAKLDLEQIGETDRMMLHQMEKTAAHAHAALEQDGQAMTAYHRAIRYGGQADALLGRALLHRKLGNGNETIQDTLAAVRLGDVILTLPGGTEPRSSMTEAGSILRQIYLELGEYTEGLRYANAAYNAALRSGLYSPEEIEELAHQQSVMRKVVELKRLKEPEDLAEEERLRRELEDQQRREEEERAND